MKHLVPVELHRTETSFVVVEVECGTLGDAQEIAVAAIRKMCRDHTVHDIVTWHTFGSDYVEYDTDGLFDEEKPEDYSIDLVIPPVQP